MAGTMNEAGMNSGVGNFALYAGRFVLGRVEAGRTGAGWIGADWWLGLPGRTLFCFPDFALFDFGVECVVGVSVHQARCKEAGIGG